MTPTLWTEPHPTLEAAAFLTTFPAPLGQLDAPVAIRAWFDAGAQAPFVADEAVRKAVRDLLRHGGFKPTGRNKPACEYLITALEKGWLSPTQGINTAVDACNAASLHSGLPISVLDAELATAPWRLALCEPGTRYVFNPSGQVIDVGGLITLHDAQGPCGGPVKDSQRTKTHDGTTRTLSVVWGTRDLPGRAARVADWYRGLLEATGATIEPVPVEPAP